MKAKNKLCKTIAISLIFTFLFSAAGCEHHYAESIELPIEQPEVGEKTNKDIYIWTDDDTGVQYIIYREKTGYAGFGGITPRLNPDGSLYIVETNDDDFTQSEVSEPDKIEPEIFSGEQKGNAYDE